MGLQDPKTSARTQRNRGGIEERIAYQHNYKNKLNTKAQAQARNDAEPRIRALRPQKRRNLKMQEDELKKELKNRYYILIKKKTNKTKQKQTKNT